MMAITHSYFNKTDHCSREDALKEIWWETKVDFLNLDKFALWGNC